jgi:hydrogenase maturation protein HypF
MAKNKLVRKKIIISGRVQGVGFRPFVYNLAHSMKLAGLVGNNSQGVFIEAEGEADLVADFVERLPNEIPPLATIAEMAVEDMPPLGITEFTIKLSKAGGVQKTEVSPDVATCQDCLRESLDPEDRRFGYPFTNCTNCGPRYSIIQGVPYDRPKTTMSDFIMCPDCQAEYDDPLDRRFHAQPNACPVCGPHLSLADPEGNRLAGDPIAVLAERLQAGDIAGIKGLGGFHLAVRADLEESVAKLRQRKGREAKPFALMVGTIEEAEKLVHLNDSARQAMLDWSRPIVLAPRKSGTIVCQTVAPDTDVLGIMLPYTPFHQLLFATGIGPLVMTSGNPSDEPLSSDNQEAIDRLSHIVDFFLLHNRDIERRVDDSVLMTTDLGPDHGGDIVFPLRRSRGFVPQPMDIKQKSDKAILAVGGEMKSAVCLLNDGKVVFSEHLGELHNPASYRNFIGAIDRLQELLDLQPDCVAFDLHPGYSSHRYAQGLGMEKIAVQHHHAHVVSCMAENNHQEEVIGVAIDGTGYGTDGTVWGCEIMRADEADFERLGHLRTFMLPGSDAAARETWRPAAGLMHEVYGDNWPEQVADIFDGVNPEAIRLTAMRMEKAGKSIARTSSLGRLFDAVSYLLGVTDRNRYEAESAIRLENLAHKSAQAYPLDLPLRENKNENENENENGLLELDYVPMLEQLIAGRRAAEPVENLALGFHLALANTLVELVKTVAAATGIKTVALTGGSFANKILLTTVNRLLLDSDFKVLLHRKVPPGDGGLALGQAVIAAARLQKGK